MLTQHAISRPDANAEIARFLAIREEITKGFVENLPEASRKYLSSTILSFVFHKDQVDNLFSAVDANAYRIYFAAKASGEPSLVIIPCTISENEQSATNKISATGDPGSEHGITFSFSYDKSKFDVGNE